MARLLSILLAILGGLAPASLSSGQSAGLASQTSSIADPAPSPGEPPRYRADASGEDSALWEDRAANRAVWNPPATTASGDSERPVDWASLLRPRFDLLAEWEPDPSGVAVIHSAIRVRQPTYPLFGPPPPMLTGGYAWTNLDAPAQFDLPSDLHEASLGMSWLRPINDRWSARLMLSGAFASDLENTSRDAWQLRGGGFALLRPNEQWSFAFGALATGRDDLPVLPAVGAIWQPSPELRVDLMMPHPRVSRLLAESGERQHWGYLGGGLEGGTWAIDRPDGVGDRLSYRQWRLVLGWESKLRQPPGSFAPRGTTLHVEVGYALGRKFEFDRGGADIPLGDTLLIRSGLRF